MWVTRPSLPLFSVETARGVSETLRVKNVFEYTARIYVSIAEYIHIRIVLVLCDVRSEFSAVMSRTVQPYSTFTSMNERMCAICILLRSQRNSKTDRLRSKVC